MIFRGPVFLVVVPIPSPSPVSKLSLFLNLPVCGRSSLLTGEGKPEGGRDAKSCDREKAWPSINNLILCDIRVKTLRRNRIPLYKLGPMGIYITLR
jgi:hypothetical protein